MVDIRLAALEDAAQLHDIYAYYVQETGITFEYEAPSENEFGMRIARIMERYPYLVAVEGNEILGYTYAGIFKDRPAYDWSVETTIYLRKDRVGQGVGKALYGELERRLKLQNIINLNACIAYPNPASVTFHERMGYHMSGHFTKCGYKNGIWYDMVWMEKMISDHPVKPLPVIPVGKVSY